MWEERLHSKKVNHTVPDILQGQRSIHQNLGHKQLWYTGFLISVFLTHTCGFCQGTTVTLGHHIQCLKSNIICTSGTECSFWLEHVRRDGEARQTQCCWSGSHICLLVPFSEPQDIAVLWISPVLGLGKRQWDKIEKFIVAKVVPDWGELRCTSALISVNTTVNEPHAALVSKNFSLAHLCLQRYKQQGRSYFWSWWFSYEKGNSTWPAHGSFSSPHVQVSN